MHSIAFIRSSYPQRFGIPRQSGLVGSAIATIDFEPTQFNRLALRDLDTFSHLWVIFRFHRQRYRQIKPLVQPPRLGGSKHMGVYATRSPNRPNSIGLSAVKLCEIRFNQDVYQIVVSGGDFLDGTPVLDIKPYVPFTDAISTASSAWATPLAHCLTVSWRDEVLERLTSLEATFDDPVLTGARGLKTLIEQTLAQDPRPAHEREKDGKPGQHWGVMVGPVNVRFIVEGGVATIVLAETLKPNGPYALQGSTPGNLNA